MIVRISKGRSFQGAGRYYLHDRNAQTSERVAWTETMNMLTDDPAKAVKVMSYTCMVQDRLKEASGASACGRKLTKPVFTYSLSWHPDEEPPTRDHMLETAQKSVKALGLEEHEILVVAHRDTKHPHCHLIINRVNPMTGLAGDVRNSKRKLSDFAREYERRQGHTLCPQREENFQRKLKGERTMQKNAIIQNAWITTTTGKGFIAALNENGYQLAQGRRRLVVIDPYGRAINPTRLLEDVKVKDLRARLKDVEVSGLPDATELSRKIEAGRQTEKSMQVKRAKREAQWINELQDRHHQEKAHLYNTHHGEIQSQRVRLHQYHKVEEQQEQLAQLNWKLGNLRWWQRIIGTQRRVMNRRDELERNLGNSRWRIEEKISHLEKERDRAVAQLAQRHAQEKLQLVQNLTPSRQPERKRTRSRGAHQPAHAMEPRKPQRRGFSM